MTTARISRRDVLKAAVTGAGVATFPRVLQAQPASIKVGVVSPVTGAMAEVGGDCRLGAQMAADAINAAGGIASMGGARLELLLADSQTKLDVARQLRLARDRWALRAPEFRRYWTAITEPIDLFALFARMRPALDDIKSLAGSTPATLAATDRAMMQITRRAAAIAPPDEMRAAHALIVSAAQLADNAASIRREATLSGSIARAWDASSAAAGAMLLGARAKSDIEALLRPPELR